MDQRKLVWSVALASGLGLLSLGGAAASPNPDLIESESLDPTPRLAQADPSQNRFPSTGAPAEPLPLDPASPPTSEPTVPPTPTPSPTQTLEVRDIQVVGSTVFSDADLEQAVRPFENRTLTLEELQQAADAVTQIYLNAGYITSRAIVPEQTAVDGTVQLQVLEGRLAEIQVEGTDRLIDYVRSRVALGGTQPVSQARLEDQLRLLRADPLFDNVEASLRAGTEPGSSILIVRVAEADPFIGNLTVDTLSPRSVGEFRTGITLGYRNLAGLGDTLLGSYYRSTTGGSNIYDFSYQVPLNPMNGTLLLHVAPNTFRITDPNDPSFRLGVSGSNELYEAVFRQPLVRTPREEFALSLGFRYRSGSTLQGGFITPATVTSVVSFGQDYLRRDLTGAWSLRSQFRLGTGLFNATSSSSGPDGQFFSWLGQVQRVQVLNPDNLLIVQGDVQLSPDSLLGSEQFFIGGGQSVRGYYQNARFGDNGLRLSVEDRITLFKDDGDEPIVQIAPFLDLGYVWFNDASIFRQNFLLGTGAGVILTPIPDLTARLDFGVPLVTVNQFASDRPSGLRVYFNVNYQL
ncbi:MAG TPA: ShlB/FhaC/HecB family hemolysin secretion/activation protein [Leptolyngbyaceae cyanobacterium]